ncbi:MAG: fluoride efflux transporter CrcB [Bacteroidetes bacterium]|nr:fluoride efflux transporter CrcB [Bacteroidota bacterium]
MLLNCLLVGAGGFIGAIFRYLASAGFKSISSWPLGTLAVNLLGSFVLGWLVYGLAEGKGLSESQRLLFAVGFCGALTTMSTFALESHQLFTAKGFAAISINVVFNVLGSLAMIWFAKRLFA